MKKITLSLGPQEEQDWASIKAEFGISSDIEAFRLLANAGKRFKLVPANAGKVDDLTQKLPANAGTLPVNAGKKSLAKKPVESSDEEVDWRITANRGISY